MFNRAGVLKEIKKNRWGYYYIIPGYMIFLFFSLVPMISAIRLSFFKANIVRESWNGIGNYVYIFNDMVFIKGIKNTIMYAILIVPSVIILSLFIASIIYPMSNRLQSLYRGVFYLPAVVGGVIISSVWVWIYHPIHGLLNSILQLLGFNPVLWLADSKIALISICITVLTWNTGTSIILYVAGIGGISKELYEAAYIDGSSHIYSFFKITIPLLKPVTVFILTTQLIAVFQIWEAIYMLTEGGPYYGTTSMVYYLYQTAFVSGKYGVASAQGMILLIIIVAVTLISLRVSKQIGEK